MLHTCKSKKKNIRAIILQYEYQHRPRVKGNFSFETTEKMKKIERTKKKKRILRREYAEFMYIYTYLM